MLTTKEQCLHMESYGKMATIYYDDSVTLKTAILYFHGGGLLYGTRTDLPDLHKQMLTKAGCAIISYDYPLAPGAKLDLIVNDVIHSINHYIQNPDSYLEQELPFYLWGRSAGAYLCLIAAASDRLLKTPKGVLSYYGYGFLCDNWFQSPSAYYNTLPKVPESCLSLASDDLHTEGELDTHYSIYVYARQTGNWKSLFYEGRDKFFYLDYSLRLCEKFPCPLLCAHSINDTDVPYAEFLELCKKYDVQRFVASRAMHDFDRDEDDPFTTELLNTTIRFVEEHLEVDNRHVKL